MTLYTNITKSKMSIAKADVLLGLQWGDEGKGKVVDVLTPHYDVVARFQGGPNAGHTLEFDGKKYVLRSIPSGIFQPDTINIIGSGVVLDPILFMEEAKSLEASGVDITHILKLSKKAHLILPTHRLLDAALEAAKGSGKIGTTGKGIGPTYTDKISRQGLRLGDTLLSDFDCRYRAVRDRHLSALGTTPDANLEENEKKFFEALEYMHRFDIVDSELLVNKLLGEGKSILCEGAQGTMLDIDYGSYPFVTSSNTVAAGACTGLGLAPKAIGKVYGIFKAYCTRVGSGPFPTELFDATGAKIRDIGHEYGAVTGRERRCGWIDLVALRYAVMINGVTDLIMMKSDVLDGFSTIKACTAYRLADGTVTTDLPYSINPEDVTPIFTELPGWQANLTACKSENDLPEAFTNYISSIEEQLGVPVTILSVGPDRTQTIIRDSKILK